jgi:hypothetical protein
MPTLYERLDANESVFFERQLKYAKRRSYDVLYADLGAREWLPISTDNAEWAKTITYEQYDNRGAAAWIASYADDLPRCDVVAKEFSVPARPFGESYGWNIDEIQASNALNKNLNTRKAESAASAFRQFENDVAWFAQGGKADAGVTGLLYNANITISNAPTGTWSTATPDQIIADVNFAINNVRVLTKNVEKPNRCLMGIDAFTQISTQRLTDTNVTILSFLRENHPGVKFGALNELDDVSPKPSTPTVAGSSTNIILVYTADETKLALEVVRDYTTEPPERRNLEYVVNTHGKTAGVSVYYPLSVHIVEGI